jgi:NIPSNAP
MNDGVYLLRRGAIEIWPCPNSPARWPGFKSNGFKNATGLRRPSPRHDRSWNDLASHTSVKTEASLVVPRPPPLLYQGHKQFRATKHKEALMLTLFIRYTIDANKLADFEAYARALPQPVERCGGKFVAYYLPTKIAGPTNSACGLIDFPDLASYQRYREQLMADPDGSESLRRVEAAGCILNEERSFVRRIPE